MSSLLSYFIRSSSRKKLAYCRTKEEDEKFSQEKNEENENCCQAKGCTWADIPDVILMSEQAVQDEHVTQSELDSVKQELANEKAAHEETKVLSLRGRNMAKTYWERWRHELEECKELQKCNMVLRLSKQLRMSVF